MFHRLKRLFTASFVCRSSPTICRTLIEIDIQIPKKGNQTVIEAHYERIDRQAARLETAVQEPGEDIEVETNRNWTALTEGLLTNEIKAYEEMVVRPPPNHWRRTQIDIVLNQTGLELPPELVEEKEVEVEGEKKSESAEDESSFVEKWKGWLVRYN
jgi:hypothetical protein